MPYPLLFQLNTRTFLRQLSDQIGRKALLTDIPDDFLESLAERGFNWIWLLSVWQTGEAGRQISRQYPGWQGEFRETLPDLSEEDIGGSGFAIQSYEVSLEMGGAKALASLRDRMRKYGLRLMLDFVPNHMAPDHPWINDHPEFFIEGNEAQLAREPFNYIRVPTARGSRIFAHGRDPWFPGWPDTLQLDYSHPELQEAMVLELLRIADQCDGLRCDMAMLLEPDVFEQTWGRRAKPFWPAAIQKVKTQSPDFCFLAEVYWDREGSLQEQGFDYTYDKRLYDRLREGHAPPILAHLSAPPGFQQRMARFLENHDEARAATAFPPAMHEAAALICFLTPGLRFFHEGQTEGHRVKTSPHLIRRPPEPDDPYLIAFYSRLLSQLRAPIFHHGKWSLMETGPAWEGNEGYQHFICFKWESTDDLRLIVVNYSAQRRQCLLYANLPPGLPEKILLFDTHHGESFERNSRELHERGLYLDEAAWEYRIFSLK